MWKRAVVTIAKLLIIAPIVLSALVIAADLLPDDRVADALIAAEDSGPMNGENRTLTWLDTPSDRWTECTTLTMGLSDGPAEALHSRTYGPCSNAAQELQAYANGRGLPDGDEYYRYWWANTAITRPSVLAIGLPATRVLAQIVLGASFMALLLAWRKRIGMLAALAYLGPIVVATDFLALFEAVHQAISLFFTLLAGIVMLIGVERSTHVSQVLVTGAFAGALLHPFDLMISIPLAAALCVSTAMIVEHQRQTTARPLLTSGLAASVGWWVGYAGVWLSKWAVMALLVGPQEIYNNIRTITEFRINGEVGSSSTDFGNGAWSNIDFWIQLGFAKRALVFEAAILAGAVVLWFVHRSKAVGHQPSSQERSDHRTKLLCIVFTAILPFCWYEFASNHSQIHNWIMFRAISMSVGIVAVALVLATRQQPTEPSVEQISTS